MLSVVEFNEHIQVLNYLTSPIYVKDINHLWVYVNPAFCKFFGQPKEFLLGKSDYDVTPKEQSDVFWEKDDVVFKTKQTNVNIEVTTNSVGEEIWVESKKSYFENSKGEKFIFGVLTDITLLKAREFELREAWKKAKGAELAKSQFLANMSHEIRTPMNGILGMADLLERSDLPPKQKDFVGIIQRSGNALMTILNDILDFSKLEAGQLLIDPIPFNLRDCIEDVVALLAPAVSESGIDLLLRIQPGLPEGFVGDVGRIRQILTNIIGNAVKFTADGHVYIDVGGTVSEGNANLTISIEDTGIGIALDKLKTVFDKFSQADTSTTREYGGTGLGLNIAKELVHLMGGKLDVKSEEGKGSCFIVYLELPCHHALTRPPVYEALIKGLKILIVDDNEINRTILTEQINHLGGKSVAVSSVKSAVAVLNRAAEKSLTFDLVITDYQMPKQNGEDLVRTIKSDERFKGIPSIMLSSVDKEDLRARMNGLGIGMLLSKPTRSSALLEAIASLQSIKKHKPTTVSLRTEEPKRSATDTVCFGKTDGLGTDNNCIDVLIAEDNEVNQLYVSYVMDELSLKYKVVPNGKIAIDKWKLLSPKIILMDISMPELNGYEATAEIRKLEAKLGRPHTPIIAVTAHALKGDKELCLQNGMDDYLSKPISQKRIIYCLQNWGVISAQIQAK